MDVRILGPLEVRADGRGLDLGGPRPRALFTILALNIGEVVPVERLADELWGEEPPKSAHHLLHVYVSSLRKELGARLVTSSPGYFLELDPDELDSRRFERLFAEGARVLAGGDPQRASETLREALRLWRGPALADFAYQAFAQAEITRLEEFRLAALEERIAADLALGRGRELVGELEALIAQHPLRERLRAQLMLALYRSGRQASALAVYQDARRRLVGELGLEPSEELHQLERAILTHDQSLTPPPLVTRAEPTAGPRGEHDRGAKLLERQPSLDELEELLAASRRRHGRLVLVAGEAGIGKTALVETFCRERAGGVPVLWGSCDAVLPARPFAPLSDIADRVDDSLRQALDATDRDRVFKVFLALLRQPGGSPTLVVFDDLHWADDATLDVLRVVGRRLRDLPILVIGTYRDHEVGSDHPLRLALGDLPSGTVHEIRVPPLSVAAVEALTSGAGSGIDAVALHAATAGNPFFVTEVVAAGSDDVPATVRDAVLARIARLSPSAQQAPRAASVLGPNCEPALLREVAGCNAEAVEECLGRGMLQLDGGVVRFRHELAQRAVYQGLAPSESAALHRRALSALRRVLVSPDAARLAQHAVASGDADAVLELAPAAAEQAAGLGAHREAAAHYAAALDFGWKLEDRAHAELLEGHARECFLIDDLESALASQHEAVAYWRGLGDLRREGDCLRALSLMMWYAAEYDRAIEVAEQAVELLESVSPPGVELARAYATIAQRYLIGGQDDSVALSWGVRALELAESLGNEPVAVHALTTVGLAEICRRDESGWTKLEESLRRAKAAGLEEDAARALLNLVEMPEATTRYAFADRYRDEAIAYMTDENPDLDLYRRRLLGRLAEIALERGHWDEAAELAYALLTEGRSAGLTRMKALTVLGLLRARRGDPEPWSPLDEALARAGPRGEDQELCPLHAARAEAAWLQGNMTLAGAEAEAGLALGIGWHPWVLGELGFWGWKVGCLRHLSKGSAEPYVLHSVGRYREAASAWEAIGCPYHQALALAESDDEGDLRQALEILHSLGAGPMAGRVVGRLRAIGARGIPRGPRPLTRRNPARLTAREVEVLGLLREGMRNADIAQRLVVSAKTVDHHVSAILRKLGVPNRAAAVEEAARRGFKDGETVAAK